MVACIFEHIQWRSALTDFIARGAKVTLAEKREWLRFVKNNSKNQQARLRRGSFVILPPHSHLYGDFLLDEQIVVTNDSAPSYVQAVGLLELRQRAVALARGESGIK